MQFGVSILGDNGRTENWEFIEKGGKFTVLFPVF